MAEGIQYDIVFNNSSTVAQTLNLFEINSVTSQLGTNFIFDTPLAATYPLGTIFRVTSNGIVYSFTLASTTSRSEIINNLNGLGIAFWILGTSVTENQLIGFSAVNVLSQLEIASAAGWNTQVSGTSNILYSISLFGTNIGFACGFER